MKRKLVLVTITIIALLTTLVMADTEPGDNPGDVVTNPWDATTTETPTTEEITTVEETTSDKISIDIDGRVIKNIKRGTNFFLPLEAQYGYLVNGKMCKPGKTVYLNTDTVIVSINEITVTTSTKGASICLDGRDGIKFGCSVEIKNVNDEDVTQIANSTDDLSFGMILATADVSKELNHDNLSAGKMMDLPSESIRDDNYFYCGIINVKANNFVRQYMGRGYLKIDYAL